MNWELLQNYGPRMLQGLMVTLQLVVIAISLGALLAVPIALGRMSKNRLVGGLAFAYVYAVRGTPLLAQTFLVYYGAGQFRPELQAVGLWWLFRDAFFCCALTFTLNTAAYQAEIYRGAILAVPRGQSEAAMSLGLKPRAIFRMVVVPQAVLLALRPLGNEIILMIKGSSVAAIVTVFDLMGVTRLAYSRSFDFQVYLWAAVLYLALVEIIRRVWDLIERRLTRHVRQH
ncbi:ABC transporter permease [Mesorhizobium sp. BR1-1-16]|uniref:ABC transporter permease n=1 Tax=Mesorhizobium sp. BR1-1-16 TaxID=2876653 RepID=UPI001CD00F49|nr:ABC transporter permease [Mesorhizobium sp. BR1-1-16]MBZ9935508.1 ABC transporter permease [Mesorhizobium sp. BR1-1-16]